MTKRSPTPSDTGYEFFQDTLDGVLLRRGPDGVPDVMWPDGSWHAYPDADFIHAAAPLKPEGAETLARGHDLTAPRADD